MVTIGLAGEEDFEQAQSEIEMHEYKTQNLVDKQRAFVISKERAEEIKAQFDCVVVQSFGDDYHLTEEEKEKKNKFYKVFAKFAKAKHKYARIDKYVEVVREGLKCLQAVANDNGIYEPDKFLKMFWNGKIDITGIEFPKYIGKDRKQISWKYLTEFILSDEDPKELVKKNFDGLISEEEIENGIKTLYTEEELEYILTPETEEEKEWFSMHYDKDTEDDKKHNVVVVMDKKETKKLFKDNPGLTIAVKEMRRKKLNLNRLSEYAYDFTSDDIESISEYDRRHKLGNMTGSKMPEFHGDITDEDAVARYLLALEEWETANTCEEYRGQIKPKEQVMELQLRDMMESYGYNLMKLWGAKEREKKLRKIKKAEDKKLKAVKAKLLRLEQRKNATSRTLADEYNEKKKKSKSSKKKKKMKEVYDDYKKKANSGIDDLLLAFNKKDDFGGFEEEVLDFSWDNILGGDE